MNQNLRTWTLGFLVTSVTVETIESIVYSLLIAVVGGFAATLGKYLCIYLIDCIKQKTFKPKSKNNGKSVKK